MENLTRKDKSEVNRGIYSLSQDFARHVTEALRNGATSLDVVVRVNLVGNTLESEIAGSQILQTSVPVTRPADPDEPY